MKDRFKSGVTFNYKNIKDSPIYDKMALDCGNPKLNYNNLLSCSKDLFEDCRLATNGFEYLKNKIYATAGIIDFEDSNPLCYLRVFSIICIFSLKDVQVFYALLDSGDVKNRTFDWGKFYFFHEGKYEFDEAIDFMKQQLEKYISFLKV